MAKIVRLVYRLAAYVMRCREAKCDYATLPDRPEGLRQEILRQCVLDVYDELRGTVYEDELVALELSKCRIADTCPRRLAAALQGAEAQQA